MPAQTSKPAIQPGLIMALVGTYLASLSIGLSMGYPHVSWKFWHDKGIVAKEWFYSVLPLGAILGTGIAFVSNKYLGRNKSVIGGALTGIISFIILSLGNAISGAWIPFTGVALMGVACGVVSHTAPSYLHECSHHERRGSLVAGHYAALGVGQSISIVVGLYTTFNVFWAALCLLPFVLGAALLALSPASPTWLAESNRDEEQVKHHLHLLHGQTPYAHQHLAYLKKKPKALFFAAHPNHVSTPSVYKPLGISVALMLIQQSSGIGGLLANLEVFGDHGTNNGAVLAFALSNIIASLVAPLLIDRYGRKKMLQVSGTLQTIGLGILGSNWAGKDSGMLSVSGQTIVNSVGLCIFIIGYSLGHGPIPWVMINELLPSKAKVLTTAASTSSNWIFAAVMTQIFTVMLHQLGSTVTFFVFAVLIVLGMVFASFLVPETTGLSVQELEQLLRKLYDTVFEHQEQSQQGNDPGTVEIELADRKKDEDPKEKANSRPSRSETLD